MEKKLVILSINNIQHEMWHTIDIIEFSLKPGQIESKLGILSISSLQFIEEEQNGKRLAIYR